MGGGELSAENFSTPLVFTDMLGATEVLLGCILYSLPLFLHIKIIHVHLSQSGNLLGRMTEEAKSTMAYLHGQYCVRSESL